MDYLLGVEMTKDYLSFEVSKAAYKLVKSIMLVEAGESVVITGDSSSDRRVVEAVANATYATGAVPVIIYYPTSDKAYCEPVKPIGSAISDSDVWIEFAYSSVMLSPSFQKALKNGCRYINLTGMDVTMMVNTIGRVNYEKVVELGHFLAQTVESANEVIIKDNNGTFLTAFNQGRKVRNSGQLATVKGNPVMLGGQVSWCPIEETINGTLVFDSALFPPAELGKLTEKITVTFKEGVVSEIDGGKEANIFRKWLSSFKDPNMYRLAHYSLGFNPGVKKATGRIVEDERIFGCIEFGIGSQSIALKGKYWTASSHTDGVISKPTILLDGVPLEKDGRYVDAKAVEYCKLLGVEGY